MSLIENTSSVSRDWLDCQPPALPKIRQVLDEVCAQFGVTKQDLDSECRNMSITVPRQVAMTLAKHLCKRSYPEIGRRIGMRDHTTVLHACRKYEPVLAVVKLRVCLEAPVSVWVDEFKKEIKITPHNQHTKYGKKKLESQSWPS